MFTSHTFARFAAAMALIVAMTALAGCSDSDEAQQQQQAPQVIPAQVVKVSQRDVPVWVDFVGQINAKETVEIRARVEGYLLKKNFREGDKVEKGQLLFEIDPKPFKESLKQAQSQLARTVAKRDKAKVDFQRFKKLYEQGAVSRDEYDTRNTDLHTLQADVNNDQAAVEKARIDLGYTKIHSPVTGIIGRVAVDLGNLVGRGENTLLATVSSVDPVYVDFSISERDYIAAVRDDETRPKEQAEEDRIKMILADGREYDQPGKFDMIDRAVDPSTGTLGIRVLFPNPSGLLRPGQYAKVMIRIQNTKDATVVPLRAILDNQGLKSVYKVAENGTVINQPVQLGEETTSVVIVSKGVEPGDLIIADGIQRFRAGMQVKPEVVPYPGEKTETNSTAN